jgi:hypothetical protein
VFDIQRKLQNVTGVPQSLIKDILGRAKNLTDELSQGQELTPELKHNRAATLMEQSDNFRALGATEEARRAAAESVQIMEELAKSDLGNAGWQRDLAVSYAKLASVYTHSNETDRAKHALEQGKAILERLTNLSPDNAIWKKDLAWFEEQLNVVAMQQERAAIQSAFEANDFAKAATLQTTLAETVEKAETQQAGKPGAATADELVKVSWYALFARDYDNALSATGRAASLAPDEAQLIIATNRAHALMCLDRADEARALYAQHRGKDVAGQGKWEAVIRKDFSEFRAKGVNCARMDEIEAMMKGASETTATP